MAPSIFGMYHKRSTRTRRWLRRAAATSFDPRRMAPQPTLRRGSTRGCHDSTLSYRRANVCLPRSGGLSRRNGVSYVQGHTQCAERRRGPVDTGRPARVEHAAHHGLVDAESPCQFGLADAVTPPLRSDPKVPYVSEPGQFSGLALASMLVRAVCWIVVVGALGTTLAVAHAGDGHPRLERQQATAVARQAREMERSRLARLSWELERRSSAAHARMPDTMYASTPSRPSVELSCPVPLRRDARRPPMPRSRASLGW